jgi:glycosyltransferase involved in cell wall biosynthesis
MLLRLGYITLLMETSEAIIAHYTLGLKRGIGNVVTNLVKDQTKDYDVTVFVRDGRLPEPGQGVEGVAYLESPVLEAAARTFADPSPEAYAALGGQFAEEASRYDAVYLHGAVPVCLGTHAEQAEDTSYIAYPHGSEEFLYGAAASKWQQIISSGRQALRYSVCLTDTEAKAAEFLLPEAERFIIVNAVDTDHFTPGNAPDKPSIDYLCIRPLSRPKGVDMFVEALDRVPVQFRASIVGSGPEERTIEKLVDTFGMQQKVSMYTETNEPLQWLSKADSIIFPSRSEGMSVGMLEALAVGKVVVATEVNGSNITREAGGIVVPADVDGIAEGLILAASLDEDQKKHIAQRARDYILQHHSLAQWHRHHAELLERVLSESYVKA